MEMLKPSKGSVKKKKRIGRGPGSGTGKTSGKGHKGQNSRSGGGVRPGFEGGQTPLFRRLPKRGFKNSMFKKEYEEINLIYLSNFEDGEVVDKEKLVQHGYIKSTKSRVKVLGNGEITKKLEVNVDKFTKSAKEKIEKAGGKAIEKN